MSSLHLCTSLDDLPSCARQGESAEEIAGLAQAMLELGVRVETPHDGACLALGWMSGCPMFEGVGVGRGTFNCITLYLRPTHYILSFYPSPIP